MSGGRDDKKQLGAHFQKDDAFVVKEVLARVSRKRQRTVSMQEAIYEAMADWCAKEGVTLPSREPQR